MEVTFCMIKPDSIEKKNKEAILEYLEKENFILLKSRRMKLTPAFCEIFYQEHQAQPFFQDLVQFISSGFVLALALKRQNACSYLREIMGATDPKKSAEGTIRARWGESVERNAIHGSDSPQNAKRELALFFPEDLF